MYYSSALIFFSSIFPIRLSVSNAACDICPGQVFDKEKRVAGVRCRELFSEKDIQMYGGLFCEGVRTAVQNSGCCIDITKPAVRGGAGEGNKKPGKGNKKPGKGKNKNPQNQTLAGNDTEINTQPQPPTQPIQTVAVKENAGCPRCKNATFRPNNFLYNLGFEDTSCNDWYPLKDFKDISPTECDAQQIAVFNFGCCSENNGNNELQNMVTGGAEMVGSMGEQLGLGAPVNNIVDTATDAVNVVSTIATAVNTVLCGIQFWNDC